MPGQVEERPRGGSVIESVNRGRKTVNRGGEYCESGQVRDKDCESGTSLWRGLPDQGVNCTATITPFGLRPDRPRPAADLVATIIHFPQH